LPCYRNYWAEARIYSIAWLGFEFNYGPMLADRARDAQR
jgi:hypothetical protein